MTVLKKVLIGVGGVIAFAQTIGILGHLISREEPEEPPTTCVHLPQVDHILPIR